MKNAKGITTTTTTTTTKDFILFEILLKGRMER